MMPLPAFSAKATAAAVPVMYLPRIAPAGRFWPSATTIASRERMPLASERMNSAAWRPSVRVTIESAPVLAVHSVDGAIPSTARVRQAGVGHDVRVDFLAAVQVDARVPELRPHPLR